MKVWNFCADGAEHDFLLEIVALAVMKAENPKMHSMRDKI